MNSFLFQTVMFMPSLKTFLEQLGKSLNTVAKLHHNKEFMEMAMARNLPPRKMQLEDSNHRRTVGANPTESQQ